MRCLKSSRYHPTHPILCFPLAPPYSVGLLEEVSALAKSNHPACQSLDISPHNVSLFLRNTRKSQRLFMTPTFVRSVCLAGQSLDFVPHTPFILTGCVHQIDTRIEASVRRNFSPCCVAESRGLPHPGTAPVWRGQNKELASSGFAGEYNHGDSSLLGSHLLLHSFSSALSHLFVLRCFSWR